ncbi:unnamed protein product [Brachionus calyciflorus]|uniref:Uncharacterized protein n=1 Tax=Brachionus calyciflorus TaxID=104777 RepID=A0A813M6M4_9BILA|nr:unnamed protein product [Brachionus calyciflorus]
MESKLQAITARNQIYKKSSENQEENSRNTPCKLNLTHCGEKFMRIFFSIVMTIFAHFCNIFLGILDKIRKFYDDHFSLALIFKVIDIILKVIIVNSLLRIGYYIGNLKPIISHDTQFNSYSN